MARNPSWTTEEIILVLDLYLNGGIPLNRLNEESPTVKDLSETLRSLAIHPRSSRTENFRSPSSVFMKMCNLASLDPQYTRPTQGGRRRTGMPYGAANDEAMWNAYHDRRDELRELAREIRKEGDAISSHISQIPEHSEEVSGGAIEGRLLLMRHKRRERNPALVRRKKQYVIKSKGTLSCEICGFDFRKTYGPAGEGFIECHHVIPLSEGVESRKTELADLMLVCANCHRMLHLSRVSDADELRHMISQAQMNQIP